MLLPSEDKYPWIPREHLHPIIDEELAIGYVNDFDEYMSNNYQRLESNLTWKSYFEFAKDMYESVTETEITSNTVKEIELEKNVYIFKDDSINATRNILKLYDHLLSSQPNHLQLYQNFINQNSLLYRRLFQTGCQKCRSMSDNGRGISFVAIAKGVPEPFQQYGRWRNSCSQRSAGYGEKRRYCSRSLPIFMSNEH